MGTLLIWSSAGRRPAQYIAVLQHDHRTRHAIFRFDYRPSGNSAWPLQFGTRPFVLDNFNMPFLIGGTYIYSPDLQLVLGVSVDVERKYPVLPAVGVRWKIAPQWFLDALLPTPRLQYELNRDLLLYAGATVRDSTLRCDDGVGVSP